MNMTFYRKLPVPKEVKDMFPVTKQIEEKRQERVNELKDVFAGKSDKFVLVIGPCSADREDAVMEYIYKLKKSINRAKEVMTQKLGREPSNLEISLFLDVEIEDIENAILATSEIESIEDNFDTYKSFDNTSADVLDLREEISNLPEEERKIILARYYDELTQSEVSKLLGVSQVQISRSENKILKKLKTRL